MDLRLLLKDYPVVIIWEKTEERGMRSEEGIPLPMEQHHEQLKHKNKLKSNFVKETPV